MSATSRGYSNRPPFRVLQGWLMDRGRIGGVRGGLETLEQRKGSALWGERSLCNSLYIIFLSPHRSRRGGWCDFWGSAIQIRPFWFELCDSLGFHSESLANGVMWMCCCVQWERGGFLQYWLFSFDLSLLISSLCNIFPLMECPISNVTTQIFTKVLWFQWSWSLVIFYF